MSLSNLLATTTNAPQTGVQVLLIDDERINLVVAQSMLNKAGVDCLCINDPLEAPSIIAAGNYNAVITDINMPELDGFAIAKLVFKHHGTNIPVAASTGDLSVQQACQAAGISACFGKPLDIQEILAWLQQQALLPNT